MHTHHPKSFRTNMIYQQFIYQSNHIHEASLSFNFLANYAFNVYK